MYNLARLELAARGGLFDNPHFTSIYQVIWPWSYDAVHLPFLILGWATAVPSYLCFVGSCYVAYALVAQKYGKNAAWVAVAVMLGLTCLVYQATSTKNDIPMLFCVATWSYARWRHLREKRDYHILWMVVAIGFLAGAKSTGVILAAILAVWTCWDLRRRMRLLARAAGGIAVALLLLGSVETYVETARLFGSPLGPESGLRAHRNNDGIRGAFANLTRFVFGSIYLGPTTIGDAEGPSPALARTARKVLACAELTDAGLKTSFEDAELQYWQTGFEELSGYGPIGTLAMGLMLTCCVLWRPGALWWRLAMFGMAGVCIISFTAGYTEWSNRYLLLSYTLASLAWVSVLWENRGRACNVTRAGFALLALSSAVAAPLLSFNRGPSAIVASLRDRDKFETCALPTLGKTRERLRSLLAYNPQSRVFYVVHDTSPVLPILEDRTLGAIVVTVRQYTQIVQSGQISPGDFVIEDFNAEMPGLTPIEVVSAQSPYSGKNKRIRTQTIFQLR